MIEALGSPYHPKSNPKGGDEQWLSGVVAEVLVVAAVVAGSVVGSVVAAASEEFASVTECKEVQEMQMMCKNPFKKGHMEYGCGQCKGCRINRSRLWVARMMLEACEHPYSAFVTLTYSPEHVPTDNSVSKRAVQLFLKRLREMIHPRKIRYYAVGEYGDKSWRPHYHLIIFGLSPMEGETVVKCWPYGFVKIGTAQHASMSYTAQYVTKKMTNPKDARLEGRHPEFAMMSMHPGIGFGIVPRLKEAYESPGGLAGVEKLGWISHEIRIGGKKYPLGRYLLEKLTAQAGITKELKYTRNAMLEEKAQHERQGISSSDWEVLREAKTTAALGRAEARLPVKTL